MTQYSELATAQQRVIELEAVNAELLEALEAMIATVDRAKGRPVTFHEGMRECSLTKARAAIAKALEG